MTEQYKIEKGVPVPSRKTGRKPGALALKLKEMEKGDSLFAKISVSNMISHARRHIGEGKYTVRSEKDGVRVWRIK